MWTSPTSGSVMVTWYTDDPNALFSKTTGTYDWMLLSITGAVFKPLIKEMLYKIKDNNNDICFAENKIVCYNVLCW